MSKCACGLWSGGISSKFMIRILCLYVYCTYLSTHPKSGPFTGLHMKQKKKAHKESSVQCKGSNTLLHSLASLRMSLSYVQLCFHVVPRKSLLLNFIFGASMIDASPTQSNTSTPTSKHVTLYHIARNLFCTMHDCTQSHWQPVKAIMSFVTYSSRISLVHCSVNVVLIPYTG